MDPDWSTKNLQHYWSTSKWLGEGGGGATELTKPKLITAVPYGEANTAEEWAFRHVAHCPMGGGF